jgi:hypothetical protein
MAQARGAAGDRRLRRAGDLADWRQRGICGLGHLAKADHARSEKAIADVLAAGGSLTGCVPPRQGRPDAAA